MHNVTCLCSTLRVNTWYISNPTLEFLTWILICQSVYTDFDVCIKLTVFEQFRFPDYETDFGFAPSRLVFSQLVFS
jgi:hypothetical protein